MICLFGLFNNSIYQIFHCPLFTKDWKALALFQKNPLKSHISMLDIDTYAFDLPKSSWIGPCLFGDQYTSLMSLYSRTLLPKNPKGWFAGLGSPNLIRKGILNSSIQPSCSYGAVSRPGILSFGDKSMVQWTVLFFVNTLKEAFHIDPDHQRRSDVTILQDNAPCHISRKAGVNFLKMSKHVVFIFLVKNTCPTVMACSFFRYRHAPPTWTPSKIFSVC